jgi:pimeloyl-ACP methyl ester carboxylesterase
MKTIANATANSPSVMWFGDLRRDDVSRVGGMQFDVKTAAAREPYPIEKIACPVLTISAEDDRFGTAVRARYIAANVAHGRAVIFPTGGHALVGRNADALDAITSFMQTANR